MSDFFSKNIKPCAYIPKLFLKALVEFTEEKKTLQMMIS